MKQLLPTAETAPSFRQMCVLHPQRAIQLMKDWDEQGVTSDFWVDNRPGFLIDAGSSARDADVIADGVNLLEELRIELESRGQRFTASSWYNLGNGHYAAESARRGREGYVYAPTDTPMTRAKVCFRNALAELSKTQLDEDQAKENSQLQTRLLTNYGNCLNELGRNLEALDFYSEAVECDNEHPIAWSQLGSALFKLANFVRDPHMLQDSIHALHEGLRDDRLERYGQGQTRQSTHTKLREAQSVFEVVGHYLAHEHHKPSIPSKYHEEFVTYCLDRRLFLNFSLKGKPCAHPYEDSFNLSITTSIDDDETFLRLSRVLNEMRERFAVARLLLFEAQNTPYETEFYDGLSCYIDSGDAAVYGISAAKLKLAFESTYNLLDKIALFLNEYLNLGIPKRAVNFAALWREDGSNNQPKLRQKILDGQNNFVFALYDLACDFGKDMRGDEGDWKHYKATRNLMTHRYLVLHAFDWDWQPIDGPEYHREWDDMVNATESLLYLTRNALLYLFMAVQLEEARKNKMVDEDKVMETPIRLYHP